MAENEEEVIESEKESELKEGLEESPEEESGLEEDIEKAETRIDQDKFQDIMINIGPKSPSLEQVAVASEPLTSLEMGLAEAPVVKEDDDEIKYNAISYDEKKEKSYAEKQEHNVEGFAVTSSGEIARQNLRETIKIDRRQSFQINPELQGMKKTQEDYMDFKMSDEDLTKRKTQSPFQQDQGSDYFKKAA